MKSFSKYIIISIFIISPITLLSQTTYNSRADGTWSIDGGITSCACQPDGNLDIIIIDHNISLTDSPNGFVLSNSSITINSGTLTIIGGNSDGSFEVKNGSSITVKDGATLDVTWDLMLDNGSVVNFQTGSSLIIANDFINKNNSSNIYFDGSISIGGNFSNGNGSTIEFGSNATTTIIGDCTNSGSIVDTTGTTSGVCVGSILPITLQYFRAAVEEEKVVLNWLTAEEHNNDYFTLERSTDGLLFKNIARISGAGNSSSELNYTYIDQYPLNGVSYYRLSQTDYDGTTQFFNVVYAEINIESKKFILYPNPITDNNLTIFNPFDAVNVVIIYNEAGIELQRIQLSSGVNSIVLNSLIKESGIYFFKISNTIGETLQFQKLIVK